MTGASRRRWRWVLLAAAGLAVVIAAVTGLLRFEVVPKGHALGDRAPGPRETAASPGERLGRTGRAPALSRSDRDDWQQPPPVGTGPGPRLARNGGHSGRLPATLSLAAAEPTTRIDSSEGNPALQVWVPSIRVTARGTTVHARINDDPAAPAVTTAPLVAIAPVDEEPGDFAAMVPAGPGEFAKDFIPPPPRRSAGTLAPPREYRFVVVLRGTRNGAAFERQAGGLFFVHDPRASLDPASAKVIPEGGDLVMRIEAQFDRAGTYFVYAELWGGGDGTAGSGTEAIAFARDRLAHVEPGARTLELRFDGAVLADAHVNGPYMIRNLRLQQVDTHPAHESDPVRALPPTPAWPSKSFHE
jgi:hypothetical protein